MRPSLRLGGNEVCYVLSRGKQVQDFSYGMKKIMIE